MENRTPYETLDMVLKFMRDDFAAWPYITSGEAWTAIGGKKVIEGVDMWRVLEKLVNDGYCYKELKEKEKEMINHYYITYDGKMFISQGGYVQKEVDRLAAITELENLRTLEKRLKEKVVVQNWILIAIGAVAAIYYILEIVDFLKKYYPGWFYCP